MVLRSRDERVSPSPESESGLIFCICIEGFSHSLEDTRDAQPVLSFVAPDDELVPILPAPNVSEPGNLVVSLFKMDDVDGRRGDDLLSRKVCDDFSRSGRCGEGVEPPMR